MKKSLYKLVFITFILTIINTGMMLFLTADEVKETVKQRPVVISRDYDKGQSMELALLSNKPMVVWFYTDWCGYCQKFAPVFKKVVKDKKIKEKFAVAYVNAEDSKNDKYVKEFNVEGFPMVYLVGNGKKQLVSPNKLFAHGAKEILKEEFLNFLK